MGQEGAQFPTIFKITKAAYFTPPTLFLFPLQSDIYWRLRFPMELISRDIGELTSHFWKAFPNKIDAAYERHFDHMIFFFKGQSVRQLVYGGALHGRS